jgi:hypothetical protein
MPEMPASTNLPPADPAEIEKLRHLGTPLAAIAQKAGTRAERDPTAIEIVELAGKAEVVLADVVQARFSGSDREQSPSGRLKAQSAWRFAHRVCGET